MSQTNKVLTAEQKRKKQLVDINETIKRATANFKPPEQLTVQQWAEKYRRLSPENSAEPGRWRTDRTPYLIEPMAAFTDPKVERIVVVASSQVGKTEMEMNMLGYAIDVDPGPIMWVTPTQDNAEDFSKRRVDSMIRDTKPLRQKINVKSRSSSNTVLKKKYPGGMLTLTGSNSPANLASVPARYVFGDEMDRWAEEAGNEGDPWGLLEARTTTFYNRKMVQVSTPTVKGHSRIDNAFKLGTQEYWSAKCPHCGEYIFTEFDNIRFEYDKTIVGGKKQFAVKKITYCCPECGCISSEKDIKKAPHKWVAKAPEAYKNGIRSFWINAFSSPWTSWESIIREFLEADGDPKKLKTVFNTKFGQLWEDRGDLLTDDEMLARREDYGAELPEGALVLTCGVDTQDNRLEYEVVAHGYFDETWGIEKGIINGKPDAKDTPEQESVWTRLDRVIDKQWSFANGQKLKISITLVDSGGHYTQDVYEQCSSRLNKRVFAIKGKGGEGIPFAGPPTKVNITREDNKGIARVVGKSWLYTLGVDAGKEKIMSALKVQEKGARFCHFPKDESRGYDLNFFNGLMSETMTFKNGKWRWEKLPGHQRNEALDCRNYANAGLRIINPNFDHIAEMLRNPQKTITVKQKPKYKKQKKNSFESGDW